MRISIPAFPKLVLLLSAAGLLAGFGSSFLVTPRYVSSGVMTFDETAGRSASQEAYPSFKESFLAYRTDILSRTSLSAIIQDPRLDLYAEERVRTPLEDVIDRMRRDIEIVPTVPDSAGEDYLPFRITFTYRDPRKAQQTVQTFVTRFQEEHLTRQRADAGRKGLSPPDQIDGLEARIAFLEKRLGISFASPETGGFAVIHNLSVLDSPSLPERAVYPDRARFVSIGFALGIAVALAIAVFRRRPRPVHAPAEAE
jgi:uncharacterized protein involved in exopolysaccharide biosynthesis